MHLLDKLGVDTVGEFCILILTIAITGVSIYLVLRGTIEYEKLSMNPMIAYWFGKPSNNRAVVPPPSVSESTAIVRT